MLVRYSDDMLGLWGWDPQWRTKRFLLARRRDHDHVLIFKEIFGPILWWEREGVRVFLRRANKERVRVRPRYSYSDLRLHSRPPRPPRPGSSTFFSPGLHTIIFWIIPLILFPGTYINSSFFSPEPIILRSSPYYECRRGTFFLKIFWIQFITFEKKFDRTARTLAATAGDCDELN